ncbi:MAG: hypothetical protein J7L98_05615 [Candidatus Verstraetearchaeota archaeon]|nr:hypothetical protein [Candidatus Verstraetearchaeota archaeon]
MSRKTSAVVHSVKKLLHEASKLTVVDVSRETLQYPWRKEISVTPDILKPALSREIRRGVVYPINGESLKLRQLCGLKPEPPHGQCSRKALKSKLVLLKVCRVLDALALKEDGGFLY